MGVEVKIIGNYAPNLAEIVEQEKPDIIFCDIAMPGMDGYQAVGLLKQDDTTKKIPVAFFTNMGDEESIKKGMALGACDYIVMSKTTPDKAAQILKSHLMKLGFKEEDFQAATAPSPEAAMPQKPPQQKTETPAKDNTAPPTK